MTTNYKLASEGVFRLPDMAHIPAHPDNADWRQYQEWLAEGNTPLPADPPSPPTQDELDAEAAKQYAKLVALKNMTPAQVQAWVDANINNLADAKDALKTLAIAVSILARRL